jgi:succinate dehydrogenase/fumarate reductase flavoprotein subunit
LACGGFEFDETMLRDYLELPQIFGTGCPGNAGDGIRLVQQVGAALWHMWHVHGSYGFRFPGVQVAIRNHLGGVRRVQRPVAWILVDQDGKRFMNEVPPAPQDTPVRPMAYMDPETGRYPRIPSWMIFDEEARKLGPLGKPLAAVSEHRYDWSKDNSKEIEQGWILQANTIGELAAQTKLPQVQLAATIERWNHSVALGRDADFARPAGTMIPVSRPPYYAVQAWPIVTNTQGGPRRDQYQRVIGVDGHPIPGLYAVGELGSVFGHIYMLGGNLAECVVGGRIAGRHAAGIAEASGRKVLR